MCKVTEMKCYTLWACSMEARTFSSRHSMLRSSQNRAESCSLRIAIFTQDGTLVNGRAMAESRPSLSAGRALAQETGICFPIVRGDCGPCLS